MRSLLRDVWASLTACHGAKLSFPDCTKTGIVYLLLEVLTSNPC